MKFLSGDFRCRSARPRFSCWSHSLQIHLAKSLDCRRALDALLDVTHERCRENLRPSGQSIDCLENRMKKRVRHFPLFDANMRAR